jgi:CubicO group peptidase (beta-lactamase class C family)
MRAVIVPLVIGVTTLVVQMSSQGATLGVDGARLTLDGKATFLLGFSYYGALGASEDFVRSDLDDARRCGFNWLRVWVTWESFGHDVSAVDTQGDARQVLMDRLKWLVAECDRRGMILDLTLTRGTAPVEAPTAGRLPTFDAHRRAVKTLVTELQPWRNWYLDLANERDVRDARFVSMQEIRALRALVRELDRDRLVTASWGGHDLDEQDVRNALFTEELDILTPHRPRHAQAPGQTEAVTRHTLELMKQLGHVAPVLYQEPFRRGYAEWEPSVEDFLTDLQGAVAAGAAGWCFHNGSQRDALDGQPRRSFDLSARRLFDQFDDEERKLLEGLQQVRLAPGCAEYFPPPESQGGWRQLGAPDEIRHLAGMDPEKLDALSNWLLQSDDRNFAAVVIRNGYVVLEVERGNSAKTDARRVASVSKAICATVLAIASEQSQRGEAARKMSFDDAAFDFIPWAQPLSDPRKRQITVRQLLNHTSGICPEAIGAPNDGTWEYVLGLSGDPRTAQLAFDPGQGCGYSTHALCHAALVCETVTGKPYDEFAVDALFKPIGCEHWSFQYYDGGANIGRHPSHGIGMSARDLARIGYCLLHDGRWGDHQVVPKWFVDQTAQPTQDVTTPELRWKLNPQIFSHGWELPARLTGEDTEHRHGTGIPADARSKPGSGGQLLAFVPSLQLVIARQTGGSGGWDYEEYLRRACAAVIATPRPASPQD